MCVMSASANEGVCARLCSVPYLRGVFVCVSELSE